MDAFAVDFGNAFAPTTLAELLLVGVIALIIAALVVAAFRVAGGAPAQQMAGTLVLLFTLGILGAVTGTLGGQSRVGAVGAIVPAILAIAAGASVYLFGIDRSKGTVASVAVAVLAASVFWGYQLGSNIRSADDFNTAGLTACYRLFFDPALYAKPEFYDLARQKVGKTCDAFWTQ